MNVQSIVRGLNHDSYTRVHRSKKAYLTYRSTQSKITASIRERMLYSWKENNPVPLHDLRYITVPYYGFDQAAHRGEMVVHKKVAAEVIAIFEELFLAKFPIEKMVLIDVYRADDDASMDDNNSSAFCSRPITGTTNRFSKHSYGAAIDINPRINPYVKGAVIAPKSGAEFADRAKIVQGTINETSACFKAFQKRGWRWGGNWTSLKDYQHFEKEIALN